MKRPLAYVSAAMGNNEFANTEALTRYCRTLYEAGYAPICPALYLPLFLDDGIPQEHKDSIDISRDLLKRSRVVVLCGKRLDETVKSELATALRLRITATTLDGILAVRGQGRDNRPEEGV